MISIFAYNGTLSMPTACACGRSFRRTSILTPRWEFANKHPDLEALFLAANAGWPKKKVILPLSSAVRKSRSKTDVSILLSFEIERFKFLFFYFTPKRINFEDAFFSCNCTIARNLRLSTQFSMSLTLNFKVKLYNFNVSAFAAILYNFIVSASAQNG